MATSVDSVANNGIRMLQKEKDASTTNSLDQDAFLQILVTQMANQDPLSPTTDTEFIAQMAQFSSLEQMQMMNESMQAQASYSYLDKDVVSAKAMDSAGNLYAQEVYGQVIAVTKVKGEAVLQVRNYADGKMYNVPPAQVLQTTVSGGADASGQLSVYSYFDKDVTASRVVDASGSLMSKDVYGRVIGSTRVNGADVLQVQDFYDQKVYYVPTDQVQDVLANTSSEQYLANLNNLITQLIAQNNAQQTTTSVLLEKLTSQLDQLLGNGAEEENPESVNL